MTKINIADTAGRNLWLMKSEPDVYGWDDLVAEGEGTWDGVRNHLAARNLRTMQPGDLAFFYHSNIGIEIVGVIEISVGGLVDPTDPDGKWAAVKVKPVEKLPNTVTLKQVKATPELAQMDLIRLSRLSVGAVRPEEWALILKMAGAL
ncbi:MAG: ubiquinol-cytochrome C reductase [Novosphingobium sp. 32-60-15]|uniref:EVE domain-containing protein n=1 Tax=unclassified Novosphingobium TaxID=2644732 RepID=UPI000BDB9573|nr:MULTISPECIES: EVE domain-containing protein [unclassified Novosphingobium]OYX61359.1 MAG: ubiquinol-cytochrome C reductase [Novosphingobium sp. 32-60-15]